MRTPLSLEDPNKFTSPGVQATPVDVGTNEQMVGGAVGGRGVHVTPATDVMLEIDRPMV